MDRAIRLWEWDEKAPRRKMLLCPSEGCMCVCVTAANGRRRARTIHVHRADPSWDKAILEPISLAYKSYVSHHSRRGTKTNISLAGRCSAEYSLYRRTPAGLAPAASAKLADAKYNEEPRGFGKILSLSPIRGLI